MTDLLEVPELNAFESGLKHPINTYFNLSAINNQPPDGNHHIFIRLKNWNKYTNLTMGEIKQKSKKIQDEYFCFLRTQYDEEDSILGIVIWNKTHLKEINKDIIYSWLEETFNQQIAEKFIHNFNIDSNFLEQQNYFQYSNVQYPIRQNIYDWCNYIPNMIPNNYIINDSTFNGTINFAPYICNQSATDYIINSTLNEIFYGGNQYYLTSDEEIECIKNKIISLEKKLSEIAEENYENKENGDNGDNKDNSIKEDNGDNNVNNYNEENGDNDDNNEIEIFSTNCQSIYNYKNTERDVVQSPVQPTLPFISV